MASARAARDEQTTVVCASSLTTSQVVHHDTQATIYRWQLQDMLHVPISHDVHVRLVSVQVPNSQAVLHRRDDLRYRSFGGTLNIIPIGDQALVNQPDLTALLVFLNNAIISTSSNEKVFDFAVTNLSDKTMRLVVTAKTTITIEYSRLAALLGFFPIKSSKNADPSQTFTFYADGNSHVLPFPVRINGPSTLLVTSPQLRMNVQMGGEAGSVSGVLAAVPIDVPPNRSIVWNNPTDVSAVCMGVRLVHNVELMLLDEFAQPFDLNGLHFVATVHISIVPREAGNLMATLTALQQGMQALLSGEQEEQEYVPPPQEGGPPTEHTDHIRSMAELRAMVVE